MSRNRRTDSDFTASIQDLGAAFEDFRSNYNDKFSDLDESVRELEASHQRMVLTGGRLPGGGVTEKDRAQLKAFDVFLRSGDPADLKLSSEGSVGTQTEGGYWVGPFISDSITATIRESSPIRQIARAETIPAGAGDAFEEILDRDEAAASWVGEKQARPDTDSPDVAAFRVPLHEIYASPKQTQKLLDMTSFDIAGWLNGKVTDKFGRTENTAFVTGDGIKKPRGFLTYPTSATGDATRTWGELEHVVTGAAGAYAGTDPGDALITLVHKLKTPYRDDASWLMNRETAGTTRKLKDGDGNYLWERSVMAGQPDFLLGFPVRLAEDMPDIAANSLSIAFGNFKRAYLIVDHGNGTSVLRDPFTDKPFVKFYTTRQVGGDVANFEAIKLLKFSA